MFSQIVEGTAVLSLNRDLPRIKNSHLRLARISYFEGTGAYSIKGGFSTARPESQRLVRLDIVLLINYT